MEHFFGGVWVLAAPKWYIYASVWLMVYILYRLDLHLGLDPKSHDLRYWSPSHFWDTWRSMGDSRRMGLLDGWWSVDYHIRTIVNLYYMTIWYVINQVVHLNIFYLEARGCSSSHEWIYDHSCRILQGLWSNLWWLVITMVIFMALKLYSPNSTAKHVFSQKRLGLFE